LDGEERHKVMLMKPIVKSSRHAARVRSASR
jgi:hypothetical protein